MNIISMATEWTGLFGTLQEKLFLGTAIAIVGFIIVFLLLIAIIISIAIMSGLLNYADRFRGRKKIVKPEITGESEVYGSNQENDELVAVITAALSTYIYSAKPKSQAPYPGFRVRSIRRL